MNTNNDPSIESASKPGNNPCYQMDSTVASLNALTDDGNSYLLPYAHFLHSETTPNPALETSPDAQPQKILICFVGAEVTVLGSGLSAIERGIQAYELKFVKSVARRYAPHLKSYVAAVSITFNQENV
jgi:hypothetical protein